MPPRRRRSRPRPRPRMKSPRPPRARRPRAARSTSRRTILMAPDRRHAPCNRHRLERKAMLLETISFTVVLALVAVASAARAETADAKAAARARFEKGVAAFDERRFAEAAQEFEAAYKLSPAFVVLYNIGQVNVVLGRAVEAADAFDRYLKQGASAVSAERRREVEAEIEKQTA